MSCLASVHTLASVLTLIALAGMADGQCTGTDPCAADCTGCNAEDKVPNPDDCATYYVCFDNTADDYYKVPIDCPAGQVFDLTKRDCETGAACQDCSTTTPSVCPYECSASSNPAAVPKTDDCNAYYTCASGAPDKAVTCGAEAPFFDGTDCQADERRCCHCKPYCLEDGSSNVIPDPLDCRGFYFCNAADAGAAPASHGACNDGYFDPVLKDCSATTCKTHCTNVVGADGCIEPFTCLEIGYFARCPLADECTAEYYHCAQADGTYQEAESCPSGQVFNPNTHNCASKC